MKIFKKILSLVGLGDKPKSKNKPNAKKRHKNNRDCSTKRREQKQALDIQRTGKRSGRNSESKQKQPNITVVARKQKAIPQVYDVAQLQENVAEFAQLGLSQATLSAIKDMGYHTPTDIQRKAISVILSGKDVIGTAQTGTGKTAAFALPIIDKIKDLPKNQVRVLVLSPTRELASQTVDAFDNFSKYADICTLLVQGGVSINKQIQALRSGVEVVVATPGRLLDLYRQREISLKGVEHLILDEVDRMFDMGFIEDVSAIIRACPKTRQTLFFSATMPDAVMRLSAWALKEPEKVDVGIVHSPADTIEHFIYPVDAIQKYDLLVKMLEGLTFESLIVFTRTRIDADRITQWLVQHNYTVSTLHSDRTQKERDKALQDFKTHKTSILVATDIASRGLDISGVGCVINYNVPEHSEDYVHRIGRTGRANTEGVAMTLFSSDETSHLKRIESFIGAKIQRRKLDFFDYRTAPDLEDASVMRRPRKRNR